MARRSRISVESEDVELNMTPMLDVVFILLIFFIVTSVFVKTPGIDPKKPVANTGQSWNPGIMIAVDSNNEIWIDKRPYSFEEVRPVIISLREENPKANGEIIADQNTDAGVVMKMVDLMRDLDIDTRVGTKY